MTRTITINTAKLSMLPQASYDQSSDTVTLHAVYGVGFIDTNGGYAEVAGAAKVGSAQVSFTGATTVASSGLQSLMVEIATLEGLNLAGGDHVLMP